MVFRRTINAAEHEVVGRTEHAHDHRKLFVFDGHAGVLRGRLSAYVSWSPFRDRSNRKKRDASRTRRRRQRNTLGSND
jgi:hypothetical protein